MDAKSLYIIKRETGVCMYHKDFTEGIFDPHLISSFIVAMTSFFDEATNSITSRARAFEGTDYKIVVEFGEWALGALSVRRDSENLREKLRKLVEKFEEMFSLLRWVEMDLAVYTRFERHVIEELIRDQIDPDSIIRLKLNWDLITNDPDVRSFLRLLPDRIGVKDAAEFLEIPLEIALDLVAEALWEKAISLSTPVKPDDIYQTTSLMKSETETSSVSQETVEAISQLDGETPLSIAAERVKTADMRAFLDEIAQLAEQQAIERVSPAQARLVLYSSVLQLVLKNSARILGFNVTRRVFYNSRNELTGPYSWLHLVDLEEGVDVEIRSSLTAATMRDKLSPAYLSDGFRALLQFITKRISNYTGTRPINQVLVKTKQNIERQFPSLAYEVEWERLTAQST
ncbi:hypothetical protein EU524_01685 [Candidatus Thorarchaeota archaeon]|nr:MAG: hypothetical protein EU524_01685 [Candidatus Thorarchaeota archaeon]